MSKIEHGSTMYMLISVWLMLKKCWLKGARLSICALTDPLQAYPARYLWFDSENY